MASSILNAFVDLFNPDFSGDRHPQAGAQHEFSKPVLLPDVDNSSINSGSAPRMSLSESDDEIDGPREQTPIHFDTHVPAAHRVLYLPELASRILLFSSVLVHSRSSSSFESGSDVVPIVRYSSSQLASTARVCKFWSQESEFLLRRQVVIRCGISDDFRRIEKWIEEATRRGPNHEGTSDEEDKLRVESWQIQSLAIESRKTSKGRGDWVSLLAKLLRKLEPFLKMLKSLELDEISLFPSQMDTHLVDEPPIWKPFLGIQHLQMVSIRPLEGEIFRTGKILGALVQSWMTGQVQVLALDGPIDLPDADNLDARSLDTSFAAPLWALHLSTPNPLLLRFFLSGCFTCTRDSHFSSHTRPTLTRISLSSLAKFDDPELLLNLLLPFQASLKILELGPVAAAPNASTSGFGSSVFSWNDFYYSIARSFTELEHLYLDGPPEDIEWLEELTSMNLKTLGMMCEIGPKTLITALDGLDDWDASRLDEEQDVFTAEETGIGNKEYGEGPGLISTNDLRQEPPLASSKRVILDPPPPPKRRRPRDFTNPSSRGPRDGPRAPNQSLHRPRYSSLSPGPLSSFASSLPQALGNLSRFSFSEWAESVTSVAFASPPVAASSFSFPWYRSSSPTQSQSAPCSPFTPRSRRRRSTVPSASPLSLSISNETSFPQKPSSTSLKMAPAAPESTSSPSSHHRRRKPRVPAFEKLQTLKTIGFGWEWSRGERDRVRMAYERKGIEFEVTAGYLID